MEEKIIQKLCDQVRNRKSILLKWAKNRLYLPYAPCIESHFMETQNYIGELLKELRPKDYKDFIPQIMSLVAGATIVAHAGGDASIADINKEMAKKLLVEIGLAI